MKRKSSQVKCSQCKNIIQGETILVVNRDFCSDVCHLRFWKEEMPNLGGKWITDEALEKLSLLSGEERNAFYSKIVNFILDNMGSTMFFSKIKRSIE